MGGNFALAGIIAGLLIGFLCGPSYWCSAMAALGVLGVALGIGLMLAEGSWESSRISIRAVIFFVCFLFLTIYLPILFGQFVWIGLIRRLKREHGD
jgi:hypothetical protein